MVKIFQDVEKRESYYCTKCGDSECLLPENKDNCPIDCAIGQFTEFSFFPNVKTLDPTKKIFEGETFIGEKRIKIIIDNDTSFYSKSIPQIPSESSEIDEIFTFSEFCKIMEESPLIKPFRIKGFLKDKETIEATDIFFYIQ